MCVHSILGVVLLIVNAVSFAKTDLEKRIDQATPMELYQVLEGAKIVAFSKDSLTKSGLEEKDLKNWNEITRYANTLANQTYAADLKKIAQAYDFLKASIDKLHKKGSSVDLKTIKKNAESYKKTMRDIYKKLLRSAIPPESWTKNFYQKNVIMAAEKIWPGYKKIINQDNISALATKLSASALLDNLENVEYSITTILKTKKDDELLKNRVKILNLMQEIRKKYPDILSKLDFATMASLDKNAMVVFAQAGTYEAVLSQLIREVTALSGGVSPK